MMYVMAFALISAAVCSAASYSACFPLERAFEEALHNRSIMKARTQEIYKHHDISRAELAGYLPQIHVNVIPWLASKEKLFGKNMQVIGITQTIFSLSGPLQRYHIADHNTQIACLARELEADIVQFQTYISYIEAWRVAQQQPAIQALQRASQSNFTQAMYAQTADLINETQWLDAHAQHEEAQALVDSYHHVQQRAHYAIERAIEACFELDVPHGFIDVMVACSKNHSMDYYVCQALEHRKELAIKDEEIARECKLERYHYNSYIPTISFFSFIIHNGFIPLLTDTYAAAMPGFTPFRTFWMVGFNIGWRFDGFASAHLASSSRADACAKKFERCDLEHQIITDVKTVYEELHELHHKLTGQEARLHQAQTAYSLAQAEFLVGSIAQPGLDQAEYLMEQEQYALNALKASIAGKYSELEFKSGYPDSTPYNHRTCT